MSELVHEWLRQLPESITVLTYGYVLFLLTWPAFLLLERWSPVNASTPTSNYRFNWAIIGINYLVTPAFYALAVTAGVLVGRSLGLPLFPYPVFAWSLGVPVLDVVVQGVLLFFISCFLQDVWYYWWHRWQHVIPALWELHKLHHSDETLNATTIFRSHFFELAGQALMRGLTVGLVVDLSGMPQTLLAVFMAGLLPPIWDFFIHANVRFDRLHGLLPLLSTPQFHWIHHSKLPQHQDKNFAIWLPFFDVLFGSYYRPGVDEYPPTGLSSGERIDTLDEAELGPLRAWGRMLRGARS